MIRDLVHLALGGYAFLLCEVGVPEGAALEGGWEVLGGPGGLRRLAWGAAASALLAAAAWAARAVDRSGAIAGFALAALVGTGLGAPGFALLAAFVVLGSAATRLGFRRKAEAGLAQAHGGRRGARHAVANCAVAAACALFAAVTPHTGIYTLAFAGALSSALADTVGSEIGQLWGRRPVLVTSWKAVPPGTDGAISWPGTAASAAAALATAGISWASGLIPGTAVEVGSAGQAVAAVAAAGFVGSLVDSLLGATLQRRGLLDNDAVNFANTLAGALVAVGLGNQSGA